MHRGTCDMSRMACIMKIPKFTYDTFGGRAFALWRLFMKKIMLCDEIKAYIRLRFKFVNCYKAS